MQKSIVLCADDYGQEASISDAIIELIKQSRLSATSCLVTAPNWPAQAATLRAYTSQVDIGLHFNLTEGKALSARYVNTYGEDFFSLFTLMQQSLLKKLEVDVIADECEAQLDYFVKCMGRLPNYIDGHQHVHQFPIISDAVIRVYEKHLRATKAYLRLVNFKIKFTDVFTDPKKVVIQFMGMRRYRANLIANNIPHNTGFAGVYAFKKAADYREQFIQFLTTVESGGMIMCHPGFDAPHSADAMKKTRPLEYQYFSSDMFLQDLQAANVSVSRFLPSL